MEAAAMATATTDKLMELAALIFPVVALLPVVTEEEVAFLPVVVFLPVVERVPRVMVGRKVDGETVAPAVVVGPPVVGEAEAAAEGLMLELGEGEQLSYSTRKPRRRLSLLATKVLLKREMAEPATTVPESPKQLDCWHPELL